MALDYAAQRHLDQMAGQLPRGATTHDTVDDRLTPVRTFVAVFRDGGQADFADVRAWALEHGWGEQAAHDLAVMAETVRHTMRELGVE